jgi:hypothetical protein
MALESFSEKGTYFFGAGRGLSGVEMGWLRDIACGLRFGA